MRWLDEVLEMDPLSKLIELKHGKVARACTRWRPF